MRTPGPAQGPAVDSLASDQQAVGPQVQDTEGEPAANPFAGFETHFLSNGLKVWFKRVPGAPNVSVSVAVPFGSHSDPRGKEGLAHFTEHMLFSDHDGRSEQEVKDAIESLGQLNPRMAEVVDMRCFSGMTVLECAEALGVSSRTVDKDWRFARAWLRKNLS